MCSSLPSITMQIWYSILLYCFTAASMSTSFHLLSCFASICHNTSDLEEFPLPFAGRGKPDDNKRQARRVFFG